MRGKLTKAKRKKTNKKRGTDPVPGKRAGRMQRDLGQADKNEGEGGGMTGKDHLSRERTYKKGKTCRKEGIRGCKMKNCHEAEGGGKNTQAGCR